MAEYCTSGKELQPAENSSYFGLLKSATDAKEVLEFLPSISRTKQDRHLYTLPALKTLFELQKSGKSTLRSDQIVRHPRFAELCENIQIGYKLDHDNVQQLVELLEFVSQHKVNDRTVMNIYGKLLQNVFAALERDLDHLPFKMLDYVLKKVLDKNLEHYPMFYHEPFLKRCAQYAVDNDIGLLNALYMLKKMNKISFLHIPLLDYIASHGSKLSLIPTSGIITIVAGFSNANYIPSNWDTVKEEILRNSSIKNPSIPWIRYNLELLSLDIFNAKLLTHWLDPQLLEASMSRNVLMDYLQLTELGQTLRLLYSERYQGPYPAKHYQEKSVTLMLQNNDHPLLKPLEYAFGGEEYINTQVVTDYGHVLDHVIVFDADGKAVKARVAAPETGSAVRLEDIRQLGSKSVAVLYLPKSCYAINVNRLRGRFVLHIKTIQALGVPTVTISPLIWSNLPENERIPFLQREITQALRQQV
uniref:RAP domain-containing protein n=1 Tax=Anopheles farauti TaxID=69004 RepID=A0A182QAP2_9DIPT